MAANRPFLPAETPMQEPSRRALLIGAASGIAALAATAIGGAVPRRVAGAPGDPVIAGQSVSAGTASTTLTNNADANHTLVVIQNGTSTAIRGTANSGVGGRFQTGGRNRFALIATNSAGTQGNGGGIYVNSPANHGVVALTQEGWAVWAESQNSNAVYAVSENSTAVDAYSAQGAGVSGNSLNGFGVYGNSSNSYAGYFAGDVAISEGCDFGETSTPGTPPSQNARVFARDNGSGKTQLCVKFPTGGTQILATEA